MKVTLCQEVDLRVEEIRSHGGSVYYVDIKGLPAGIGQVRLFDRSPNESFAAIEEAALRLAATGEWWLAPGYNGKWWQESGVGYLITGILIGVFGTFAAAFIFHP